MLIVGVGVLEDATGPIIGRREILLLKATEGFSAPTLRGGQRFSSLRSSNGRSPFSALCEAELFKKQSFLPMSALRASDYPTHAA